MNEMNEANEGLQAQLDAMRVQASSAAKNQGGLAMQLQ
jgi:hypothetical protein